MNTQQQIERTAKDWTNYAGEPVKVEETGGAIYGFCSELGALRIAYKYRNSGDKAKAAYSENLKTWFFRLEM